MPCQIPPWGELYAVNVDTGAVLWHSVLGVTDGLADPNTGRPNVGGPITTGGGLVFIGGTDDKRLRAFDIKTGKELWSFRLPASLYGTPMTYSARGKQIVAAVSHRRFLGRGGRRGRCHGFRIAVNREGQQDDYPHDATEHGDGRDRRAPAVARPGR